MADSTRSAWSTVTPMLLFSCFCLLVGDMLFGYDTGSFGGILANPVSTSMFTVASGYRELVVKRSITDTKLRDLSGNSEPMTQTPIRTPSIPPILRCCHRLPSSESLLGA